MSLCTVMLNGKRESNNESLSLATTANVIDTFCVAQKREKGEKERRTRTTHDDYTADATFVR